MDNSLALYPGRLHLLLAPPAVRAEMVNALVARLACIGPLLVLDGGNCFQAHRIVRQVRRQTPQLKSALERIHIARAFTCYQVVALLADTPAASVPTLVLELLSTFQDENVPLHERRRLLQASLGELRRLSQQAPTLVSAALESVHQSGELLALLEESADQVYRFEPQTAPEALRLF
jgi:hypothetical protein